MHNQRGIISPGKNVVRNGRVNLLVLFPVTEYEIKRGMLKSKEASNTSLCFIRHISNLEENAKQKRAHKYLDMSDAEAGTIDREAQHLLHLLQNEKIPQILRDERNIEYFQVTNV